MERHDGALFVLDVSVMLSKEIPSIRIGNLLAALSERAAQDRSDIAKPAIKNWPSDHMVDCAPVSAILSTFTNLVPFLYNATHRLTLGRAVSWARPHLPLLNTWCFNGALIGDREMAETWYQIGRELLLLIDEVCSRGSNQALLIKIVWTYWLLWQPLLFFIWQVSQRVWGLWFHLLDFFEKRLNTLLQWRKLAVLDLLMSLGDKAQFLHVCLFGLLDCCYVDKPIEQIWMSMGWLLMQSLCTLHMWSHQ